MEIERAATVLLDKPDKSTPPPSERPKSSEVEDEFNNSQLTFEPSPTHPEFSSQFNYYARTRHLEINTPRTNILQAIADKMTEGTPTLVRVVILNKGQEKQAFVTPDGTIFIYQSLINSLDTLDEVAGVLAHEVGHRINRTHERKGSSYQPEFAVGWIHEAGSDTLAPHLLEKAGLNSFGLSKALTKIGANSRDVEHQTSASRATQTTAQHIGIHFSTSDQEPTPLPQILKTDEVPKTNLEIMGEILKNHDLGCWRQALALLHPSDLGYTYKSLAGQSWAYESEVKIVQKEMLEDAIGLIKKRLTDSGLSKEFTNLYFLTTQSSGMLRTFSMINSPEDFEAAIDNLGSFLDQVISETAQVGLFGKLITDRYGNLASNIMNNLADYFCDQSRTPDISQIPVTQPVLFSVLYKMHRFNEEKRFMYSNSETELMSKIVYRYITHMYVKDKSTIDTGQIRQFLLQVKELGLPVSQGQFARSIQYPRTEADKTLLTVVEEIFPTEKTNLELETEQFLIRVAESESDKDQRDVWKNYLQTIRPMMDEAKFDDNQRKVFLENLQERLKSIQLIVPSGFSENLHLGKLDQSRVAVIEEAVYRLNNFDLAAGLSIFQKDGNEFYDYISQAIKRSGINPDEFEWIGLANTCVNLLNAPSDRPTLLTGNHWNDYYIQTQIAEVTDIERLLSLPILQNLIRRVPNTSFSTLGELNKYMTSEFRYLKFRGIEQIFDDSLPALLLGQNLRKNCAQIFSKGIQESEYDDLFEFVRDCLPNGREKSRVLRSIKRHFLRSREVSLDQKTDYIIRNFDDIGPDGMLEVAEQITTLSDYRRFHERLKDKIEGYLEGSARVTQLAAIDTVSSEFVGKFDKLLLTTIKDPDSAKKASNELAGIWYRSLRDNSDAQFDAELKKVLLSSNGRQTFRTLSDVIDYLHGMTPLQRFTVALKALVDKDGALTTEKSRELLGETLTKALKVNSSFINSALMIGCRKAPADFFSLSAAQILAPLFFRNLDAGISAGKDFFEHEYIDAAIRKDIGRLMTSATRDVTVFGAKYIKKPQSFAAQAIRKSDRTYQSIGEGLIRLFPVVDETEAQESNSEIDPSLEAVISGVENSGPLGTRGLQLMRQLLEFSPAVDRRLARSLDRMKGLNKLLLWENTLKLIDDAKAGRLNGGTNQPEFIDFFERRLVSLNEYLGGGSLYTTYAAIILDSNDRPVEGVIKMLRPNPKVFIETSYKTTSDVFSEIEKSGSEKDQQYARMGQVFIDLAQQWCLKDILDPSFEADDDQFRVSIDAYNIKAGREVFHAPRRLYNSFYVKSETEAEGKTLNQMLEDPSVNPRIKGRAVGLIVDLFRHQLRTPLDDEYLIHSDPHVGNYIVDLNGGTNLRVGVIDRSMYLKLTPEQAKTFDGLFSNGNYRGLISSFVDQVMDYNKVINEQTRKTTKGNILSVLTREYLSQKFRNLRKFSFDVDNFTLLRKMLEQFDQAKLDIPLEMRLMIKSIESLRELQKRYR